MPDQDPAGHELGRGGPVELRLVLNLPRDTGGIPTTRLLLRGALAALGVDRDCISDVELALSEACSNVLHHAGTGDRFAVCATVADGTVVIAVADQGPGFDYAAYAGQVRHGRLPDHDSEHGRGLHLMRALLDDLHFHPAPGGGTIARLTKTLTWNAREPTTGNGTRPT